MHVCTPALPPPSRVKRVAFSISFVGCMDGESREGEGRERRLWSIAHIVLIASTFSERVCVRCTWINRQNKCLAQYRIVCTLPHGF